MIIGLSGYAQSGKDTVAELLCLNYGFKRIAFADAIREGVVRLNPMLDDGIRVADLVEDYGWDVAKGNTEVRRLLQVFGTESPDEGPKGLLGTAWHSTGYQAFKGLQLASDLVSQTYRAVAIPIIEKKTLGFAWASAIRF